MIWKSMDKWIVGTALILAVPAILPIAKQVCQPMRQRGNYVWSRMKEEMEDFIAEAQFERMKKRFDRELDMLP
ncbi:DUF5132 domain-containing protein [Polycladomyces subterraneus]|uniref:DUF5132 domain-containing protein n=1 Tax=Polycladomyces subterraneus TaxID=1016997 RepID=A0ABT8IP90_9BACL|nr:DUF5132 domain-containing protein [Polycladomyces subterraneus]MDN4594600.1 DUF5132 domain-containing protein [Polycladomyces subterraneus]